MGKNKVLETLAVLIGSHSKEIIAENEKDLTGAKDLDDTLYDRLKLDESKVLAMVKSVKDVISIPDPIGTVLSTYIHPNEMRIVNKVVPFGNILIIYESRPDVTVEAAVSAYKAGNKIFLKGGKEAKHSNLYLVKLWHQALESHGYATDSINYLDISRVETQAYIKDNPAKIDLIIPRGGDALINYITSNTNIPTLVSGRGNNFAYVHSDADFDMASEIIINGKSRLSVCNALDKVLFNREIPALEQKIKKLLEKLLDNNINVHAPTVLANLDIRIKPTKREEILLKEFLSADIMFDTVDGCDAAIECINKYSGGHSAVIITDSEATADKFQEQVDCAAVYHNASTRFTDGGQFGLGAEIAISTQKIHFRGPMGLEQLVTNKWFVKGTGQIRS